MNKEAISAFAAADWRALGPRLLRYAYYCINDWGWLGRRVKLTPQNELTIGGLGAADFVDDAVVKLAKGDRTYRSDWTVEKNIRLTIKSDVSNLHKKLHPKGAGAVGGDGLDGQVVTSDSQAPIENGADGAADDYPAMPNIGNRHHPAVRPDHEPLADETLARQKQLLVELSASVQGDDELGLLLMAMEEGMEKPAEIEAATGIAAARVSELKRKLESHAESFLKKNQQFADLKPVKEEAS